jgi:LysR family nod box-dependent transcriptional activator
VRFKGLDLNLLVALDALLSERNVSAAARRVFISQPAMSSALARLRDHFQDELLAPVGRRMAPTAFAEALTEPLRALMLQIEATVGAGQRFDPASARRKFTISISDYMTEVIMGAVVARAAREAPGVLLEIMPPTDSPSRSLESGDIDLLVVPDLYAASSHPSELLYEEEHVVLGWSGNPALKAPLTLDGFFALGHVVVRFARTRAASFAETQTERLGRERRIELISPSFTATPKLLIGTQRVALVHRRLAEIVIRDLPLVMQEAPFEMPPLREVVQHHSVRASDGGVQWLKALMHAAADELT